VHNVFQAMIATQLDFIFDNETFGIPRAGILTGHAGLGRFISGESARNIAKNKTLIRGEGHDPILLECRAMIWSRIDFQHEEIQRATTDAIEYMSVKVDNAFCDMVGVDKGGIRLQRIQKTLIKATELARMFMQQRACYFFERPIAVAHDFPTFNCNTMCDLHGEEQPEWQGRLVLLAISPIIHKFGNERGENVSRKTHKD